jgi:kynurenine 3-monooxygenase
MSRSAEQRIAIVGGGPAGSLLAILLARRGLKPFVVERGPRFSATAPGVALPRTSMSASATAPGVAPPRTSMSASYSAPRGGRSINLALAARGIAALRRAGIEAEVAKLLIPMRGRMVHDLAGAQRFLPYGQRATEEIYSVSRAALNTLLYELAARRHGVEYRFGEQCVGVDRDGTPLIESNDKARRRLDADVVLAADGAGSGVRRALAANGAITAREELLDHGYKELTLVARGGEFALPPNALHIWPRGGFMLIGLPNPDRTFTATLFLPHGGEPSFATVGPRVSAFFEREFADAVPLIPALEQDYASHPVGQLGTVHCRPWSFANRILLVGDAAHAIVPFHGQGMNAAFEDCVALDELTAKHGTADGHDWPAIFAAFEAERAPNARAIAEMALENYREMRDDVRDPKFQLRADLSFELERRFPGRFIPRYSMVMFHPEIPYAEAQRRGAAQAGILDELTRSADSMSHVDLTHGARLVESLLAPAAR